MKAKFKLFWERFWKDFSNYFKYHFLGVLGFLFSYIAPLVVLCILCFGGQERTTTTNVWFIPILALFIIIYVAKGRKMIREKLDADNQKLVKDADRVNVAGMGIAKMVDLLVIIMSLWLVYYLIYVFENTLQEQSSGYFLLMAIFGSVGAIFFIFDSMVSVGEQLELDKKDKEKQKEEQTNE